MSLPAPDPTFEEFITHLFDHVISDPAWYFGGDAPEWEGSAELTIGFIARLFAEPTKELAKFSDHQLNSGFWYLLTVSDLMFALVSNDVPEKNRIECLRCFAQLFSTLFNSRCTDHLGHSNQAGASELNSACYMWWDILPIHGQPQDPARRAFDAAALEVMGEIANLSSIACQESALHGLGHWHYAYPETVEAIISQYSKPSARPLILLPTPPLQPPGACNERRHL